MALPGNTLAELSRAKALSLIEAALRLPPADPPAAAQPEEEVVEPAEAPEEVTDDVPPAGGEDDDVPPNGGNEFELDDEVEMFGVAPGDLGRDTAEGDLPSVVDLRFVAVERAASPIVEVAADQCGPNDAGGRHRGIEPFQLRRGLLGAARERDQGRDRDHPLRAPHGSLR